MSNEKIKAYWEERAKTDKPTTNDVYLRELEIKKFVEEIRQHKVRSRGFNTRKALDMGCGDGYSTLRIAAEFPELEFTGIDYSENMIAVAQKRLSESKGIKNVSFRVGSIEDPLPSRNFDVIMTDRCLINLDSKERQYEALHNFIEAMSDDGAYFGIENFQSGQENLNIARKSVGLPAIEVRWHNLFFNEVDLCAHFPTLEVESFSSSYYFATRVSYSAFCKAVGAEPDYLHYIHRIAPDLPDMGDCSPVKFMRVVL